MRSLRLGSAALAALLLSACAVRWWGGARDAYAYNRLLARGINLGNALEAPNEGDWGVTVEDAYFPVIRRAGFSAVRIPVRWSAHAETNAPYAIDTNFLARVDHVAKRALREDLAVVLDLHHYDELMAAPGAERARFLAIWRQLSVHYRKWPDTLCFELLNEPHGELSDEAWSDLATAALRVIRVANPRRIVVVGPAQWNNLNHLAYLRLPDDDRNLIVTFHYYEPFSFTHQGAPWVRGSAAWVDNGWEGTREETRRIEDDLDRALRWGRSADRPLYCGEFGAYGRADLAARGRWTFFVARALEERGISWAYWEFCSGFGAWDPQSRSWREPLLSALVP